MGHADAVTVENQFTTAPAHAQHNTNNEMGRYLIKTWKVSYRQSYPNKKGWTEKTMEIPIVGCYKTDTCTL